MARITGTLHEDIISHSILLRMRNVSGKCCRENQNKLFISNNLFSKIVPFMRLWKNMVQPYIDYRWQYETAKAHCMPDNYGYRHTVRVCNAYCFSTATMVTRTGLSVTLYIHCLSCLYFGKKTRRQNLSGLNVSEHSHNVICSTHQHKRDFDFILTYF
jgi:hypothetical protein